MPSEPTSGISGSRRRWPVVVAALVAAAALIAAVIGAVGGFNPVEAQEAVRPGGFFFDDNGTTHEPNIEAIAEAGITGGCLPEGTAFCPDLDVTREQMASFLARGLNLAPITNGPFTDVAGTHAGNVNAIATAGITLGCNADGTLFCPEGLVTRGQMASFLARGLGLEEVVLPTRIQLLGLSSVCGGGVPSCSAANSVPEAEAYYILEGWFYSLPFADGHESAFLSDTTRVDVLIDGVAATDWTESPVTDYFGTMVKIRGLVLDDLAPGDHVVVAHWFWDDTLTQTSEVTISVP